MPSIRRTALPSLALSALVLAGFTGCSGTSADAPSSETAPAAASDGRLTVVEDGLGAELGGELEAAASEAFAGISAPGAVMAVRTPEGTWAATVGFEDWDETTPMSADVNHRVGSVTKTFTITVLMQLADEGLLSLDDPIEQYVPGMPNGDATLFELGAMRSGIPSYTFNPEFEQRLFDDPNSVWTPEELVGLVRGEPPMFAPGTMTFYSNTNTVLLGMVIEQVTGRPIDEVLQERIFEPLGLDRTIFPTDASFPDPHAHGYTLQGVDDGVPVETTDWNPSWGWTAGSIISDLDDMLTWSEALATGDGLLPADLQQQRIDSFDFSIPVYTGEGSSAPQSPARAYGLGMGLALGWYGHDGTMPGFNTVLQHHLESGTTVIVLANSDIKSGECPDGTGTVPDGRASGPCSDPAVFIGNALAAAVGHPLVEQ
ncbi:serine hydrolase domain-containing protein [Agromyces aurantiacus]|uniref:Serine hydrolase domain-containing protein n=1 Tax=Agromyces aurantiacus TaxID=165814 RepID=A0ABV9R4Y7_9MICO|nr:serine hydrolase domain-containing protein [Agromyces aurantiacus]MBM7503739.1 D-alanyl-D-alanine carboxypeptidase [Agromyces aurantiacus]